MDWQEMRNDMLYIIRIPAFRKEKDVVLYEIVVRDLISGQVYENWLRFKVLKKMHEDLDSNIVNLDQLRNFCLNFPKLIFGTGPTQILKRYKVAKMNSRNISILYSTTQKSEEPNRSKKQ